MAIDLTLYLATDRALLAGRDLVSVVDEAVANGVTVVQLREKNCTGREVLDIGRSLHEVTQRHGVPLIVNDRVDIMLALDAEGVHLGPKDLPVSNARRLAPAKLIGASVNSLADLELAEQSGADYVGIGPVFATTTKSDVRSVLGLDGLREIAERATVPCVAIGGITPDSAPHAIRAGVSGVCAISAILGQQDIAGAVRDFRRAIARARR